MSQQIVDAINDLTRVTVAINGGFSSQAEAVRKLNQLSIPSGRIAAILAMKQSDVASIISKDKKKGSK